MTRATESNREGGGKILDPVSFRPSKENAEFLDRKNKKGINKTFVIQKALDAVRRKEEKAAA